jgi:hypothetical protein
VCVCVGGGGEAFGSNGFVTKMQPFPMDGYYRTDVINGMGHLRSDSVVPLVLRTVCCAMAGVPTLYYRSLETASTLLRMGNISGRPYCLTITITHDYKHIIYITYMIIVIS